MRLRLAVAVSALALTVGSHAEFISPNQADDGWDRGATPNSTYAAWEFFASPFGPNAPGTSYIGGTLPPGAGVFDVYDANQDSGSFIAGSGNIYSFSGLVSPAIEFGGFAYGTGAATTIYVQVRTLGAILDPDTVRLNNSIEADEIVTLSSDVLGGQFGGTIADTLFRFERPDNDASYIVTFAALAPSMSLDRVEVDSFTVPASACECEFGGDVATVTVEDLLAFLSLWFTNETSADLNGGGVDVTDLLAFLSCWFPASASGACA